MCYIVWKLRRMPPKRNAYTLFVRERSGARGPLNPADFRRYDQEWKDMDAVSKERFHKMAKDERERDDLSVTFNDFNRNRTASAGSSVNSSVFAGPKSSDSTKHTGPPLKMSDIIMEVAHGVGEIVVSQHFPNAVKNDIPLPSGEDFEQLQEVFHNAMIAFYKKMSEIVLQNVVVVSVIPVTSGDQAYVINRPLEIAIESFRITTGHLDRSVFHAFVDPGELPPGCTLDVTESRRNRHQIPAASYIKSDASCKLFNEKFKLSDKYYEMYKAIVDATEFNRQKNTMTPLLAGEEEAAATWACLKWLHDRAMDQADRDGLPDLPELVISTVEEFCANVLHHMNNLDLGTLESVQRTFGQRRYHTYSSLRCPYHQEIDSVLCARGTSCDKIYSTFDFLRGIGLKLPNGAEFHAPEY